MNNIILERIWQDDVFFEISIKCSNTKVYAETEVYFTDDMIDELYEKIESFLRGETKEIKWASGSRGDIATSCIELVIKPKDISGHIVIDVYMELNDGNNYSKYHCYFGINTEIGLLFEFNNQLRYLKEHVIGKKVFLLPEY